MRRTYYTSGGERRSIEERETVRAIRLYGNQWELVELTDPRLNDPELTKGYVYDTENTVMYATGLISALFELDVTRERIDQMLAERGLEVYMPIRLGPNFFAIRSTDKNQYDGIAMANELRETPECVFTQPLFEQQA